MDRNTLTGILLIAAIMIGWMYLSAPSDAEKKKLQAYNDSIALVAQNQQKKYDESVKKDSVKRDTVRAPGDSTAIVRDSTGKPIIAPEKSKYGIFAKASIATEGDLYIENEFLKATISPRGGRITTVQLKEYKRFDSTKLFLFDRDSSSFGIDIETEENTFNTGELYFEPIGNSFSVSGDKKNTLTMRLNGEGGKYIEYEYSLAGNSYMLGCKVNVNGMKDVLLKGTPSLNLHWAMMAPSQEKDHRNQKMASTVYYKYMEDAPDYISESKNEIKTLDAKTKWVAFKQQFFDVVLIADNYFDKTGADLGSVNEGDSSKYVKRFSTNLAIPLEKKDKESFGMRFYFGPNEYRLLKSYDLDLEKLVPLGWGIFGWVNRFLVIPIFKFLSGFNINYGIIILIMTIVFKVLLFPIAYKTYMSSAKMRVLKPEIDEINKKFEGKDAMEKQQATMALYRKAGVNPLAGCIPVLLQMPILIALLRFFPSSIELRQQGFLWAHDLSTYDSVYNFGFSIPFYGDHISLWALLMTGSTVLYTWSNSQLMGGQQQLPGMKFMMYAMPVLFLGFLNSYSSGLSYYYFLANMITFGQTWLMRKFIDEDALHRKIQENKKKVVKKSKFQERLEAMQKERAKQVKKK
jgi:YidC/Oxa1 family membrane protein insertase